MPLLLYRLSNPRNTGCYFVIVIFDKVTNQCRYTVLGPTLFLLYTNDVGEIFNDLRVSLSLFADDLKLYTVYKIDASHNDLQVAVNQLTDWASLWQLQIAIPKCTTFRISNQRWEVSKEISDKSYNIDGCILPFGSCVRDVGIYHYSRLKYNQHVSVIVHNAYKRASLILKSFHSRDPQILKHAFCVYVRHLLEFSTQFWSPHYKYLIDKVESVQRYFTKRLSGLSQLSYHDRLLNLDLQTLERRRLVYDLVFCYKILHGLCEVSLPVELSCSNTRGNNLKLAKHLCYNDVRKYFFDNRIVYAWNIVYPTMLFCHHLLVFLKKRLRMVNLVRFMTIL